MRRSLAVLLFAGLSLAWLSAGFAQDEPKEEPKVDAPAPAPEATPQVKVVRHLMATGIEDNEPVGEATSFTSDQRKVYCFLELVNEGKEQQMTVVWYHDGAEHFRQPMKILWGKKVRTWAKANLREKSGGAWKCELEDAAGTKLSAVEYSVTLSEADAAALAKKKAEKEKKELEKKEKKEKRAKKDKPETKSE